MNITVDKPLTIEALHQAEQQFLKLASELRQANMEHLAAEWDKRAGVIAALIIQISSNGGKLTNTN